LSNFIHSILSNNKKENTELLKCFLANSKYGTHFILEELIEPKIKGYNQFNTNEVQDIFKNMLLSRLNHQITDNQINIILSIVYDCIEFNYKLRATPEKIIDKYLKDYI